MSRTTFTARCDTAAGRFLPLKALDSAGLVVYLNSFSKVGFPGLRVGWLVASRPVIERLRWAKQRADLHTNLLGQAVVQELGARGWLDKWIRKTCKVYAHKQDVLRRAIERHFPPDVHVIYPDGGMSVWVELPAFLDAAELLVKARERRMIFAPARYFYFQNPRHNALRLCFTAFLMIRLRRALDPGRFAEGGNAPGEEGKPSPRWGQASRWCEVSAG